ncbi:pentraxin fusion protein-like [Ptychodera flava]|uniref:pentraxin fusion protein-like n=1 Tax=Ptychodera flava TaxID=63121 RepID=UPI00396A0CFF
MKHLLVLGLIILDCFPLTVVGHNNVAVRKPAFQSSLYRKSTPAGPENAVDGNTDSNWSSRSCTHTVKEQSPWWKVDLQDIYKVDKVVITNRGDCCSQRLVGAVVRVGSWSSIASNTQCGTTVTRDRITKSTTLKFDCSHGTKGSYVSVQLEGQYQYLTLCEVEVYGTLWCQNVAVGKPASQSSLYTLSTPAGPENAVDGNTDSNWSSQSCTHTLKERNPWWRVQLQDTYKVDKVVITNREDCCSQRLVGAVVRVGSSSSIARNTQCGNTVTSDRITKSTTLKFDCSHGTKGCYVSVQLEGQYQYLTLCEVEVYGTL